LAWQYDTRETIGKRGVIKGIFKNAMQVAVAISLALSVIGVWADATSETEVREGVERKRNV
jgi:hypothetical protein